jgi:hypothetical protein
MTSRPSEEILRKSLHLAGIVFLFLAYYSRALSFSLLAFFIVLYFVSIPSAGKGWAFLSSLI